MHSNSFDIIISKKAYNAIQEETYRKINTETGGILLGHIINDCWYVLEVIEPGPASICQPAYFEYDTDYVNKRAREVATEYKIELSLLGLWHRHPGSFDRFSQTDDITNLTFAKLNTNGAISGLVNLVPNFQLNIFHVLNVSNQPKYELIKYSIDDEQIPKYLFEKKFLYNKSIISEKSDKKTVSLIKIDDKNLENENTEINNSVNEPNDIANNSIEQFSRNHIPRSSLIERIANFFFIKNTAPMIESDITLNKKKNTIPKEKGRIQNEVETSEEEQNLYNILMKEEELLLQQKYYDYDAEIRNNKIVYINKLQDISFPYPRVITFQLLLSIDNLIFITESYGQYPFREGIFLDYLLCKAKNTFFNG